MERSDPIGFVATLMGIAGPTHPTDYDAAAHQVRGFLCRNVIGQLVAKARHIDPCEQALARSKQGRRDRDVHFVDQAGPQILLDGRDAAAHPDILAIGRLSRLL